MLDDVEHLRDAVVDLTDEPALGRDAVATEGELAGRGGLQAHLVLDVGDEHAVAVAHLALLEVEVELRDEEQRQTLGAGAGTLGAGENEVEDVLEQVVGVGRGDEALDALDVPRAVVLLDRLGAARADVGSGVGLGEHHGGAPAAFDAGGGPLLLLVGAVLEQHAGEGGAGCVHECGGLRAEHHLVDRPQERARRLGATEFLGDAHGPVAGIPPRPERLLEALGDGHRVGLRVEDRGSAVGFREGLGSGTLGERLDLGKDAARGVLVEVAERTGFEDLLNLQELEEVELEVAEVALVMAHV